MNTDKEKQENAPIPIITESEGIHWMHVIKIIEILKCYHSIQEIEEDVKNDNSRDFSFNRIQKYLSKLKEPINLSIPQIELIVEKLFNLGMLMVSHKPYQPTDPDRIYIYLPQGLGR